eukprot:1099557-Pyramimonas_sp.AAC.1
MFLSYLEKFGASAEHGRVLLEQLPSDTSVHWALAKEAGLKSNNTREERHDWSSSTYGGGAARGGELRGGANALQGAAGGGAQPPQRALPRGHLPA